MSPASEERPQSTEHKEPLLKTAVSRGKAIGHSTRLFLEQTRTSACKHSWLSPNSSQKMQFPFSDGCRVTKLRTAALVLCEGLGTGGG